MAMGIYKKGQGYWVRMMSAIAFGLVILLGANWCWDLLSTVQIGSMQVEYTQAAIVVLLLSVFSWIGFWLIGRKPRVVDFLVATEGEMKKVNWSTRREILGSTWVVIFLTAFIAVFCFSADFVFQLLFQSMGVLETT